MPPSSAWRGEVLARHPEWWLESQTSQSIGQTLYILTSTARFGGSFIWSSSPRNKKRGFVSILLCNAVSFTDTLGCYQHTDRAIMSFYVVMT